MNHFKKFCRRNNIVIERKMTFLTQQIYRASIIRIIDKFKKFLTIKLKREGDTWPKRLCQRSMDEMVRLQAG